MLVLERKAGESIVIEPPAGGVKLMITVTSVNGRRVKIGVDAPTKWPVYRSELDRPRADTQAAALQPPDEPAPLQMFPVVDEPHGPPVAPPAEKTG